MAKVNKHRLFQLVATFSESLAQADAQQRYRTKTTKEGKKP